MKEVNLQHSNQGRHRPTSTRGYHNWSTWLQRLGQATAVATGPVGLPGWHGNSCTKAYQQ